MPPPGFRPFEWPQADWDDIGDATLDPGLKFVAGWSARITEEEMSFPPPLEQLSRYRWRALRIQSWYKSVLRIRKLILR